MREVPQRQQSDRRRAPRGGRRPYDRAGCGPAVLVADSFSPVRESCARYLRSRNFAVAEAETRESLTAQLLECPPRLILTESTLPGDPTTEQWIDWLCASQVPVILIANAEDSRLQPPATAGILRKPFTPTDMIAEVRRVLRETDLFSTMQQRSTGA